jgi:hypothetical protein
LPPEPARPAGRPASVLDHVLAIDRLVRPGRGARASSRTTPTGSARATRAGFAGPSVPWQHGGPFATTMDTDHDGVPDAFDFYFGPGAYPPGV